MNARATLHATPIFAGLTEEQLASVLAVAHRRTAEPGTAILREGKRGCTLFVLLSGAVEVSKRLGLPGPSEGWADATKEKTLIRLEAPQCFGEMGLLEDVERSATVTARSTCELLEITKDDFERLAEQDAVLGYRLVRNIATVLSARLRRADRDILKLTIALSLALGNR